MAVQFSYTVKARLGGGFDAGDDIVDEKDGVARAYDRLWSELQELVLRGSQEEFKATFEIVVEECEPLEVDDV